MSKRVISVGLVLILLVGLVGCFGRKTSNESNNYQVRVNKEGKGTVTKNPEKKVYQENTKVELTAKGKGHFKFDHWVGGGYSGETKNPLVVPVRSNLMLKAVFVDERPTVSLTKNINDSTVTLTGKVTDNDGNIKKVEINWGDESDKETLTSNFNNIEIEHTYSSADDCYIRITAIDNEGLTSEQKIPVKTHGCFKIINSWGENWGPKRNGSFYMTYEAAKQADIAEYDLKGLPCYIMEPRDNYQPAATAIFDVEGKNRGRWKFKIKVKGRTENKTKTLYPNKQYIKGGNKPFPSGAIALDITELMPFDSEDIVLEATNGSSYQGALESFQLEVNGTSYSSSEANENYNVQINSGGTGTATITNVSSNTSPIGLAAGNSSLHSVSRRLTAADIEKFAQSREISGGNQIIDGHGTGWQPLTKEQWETARETGSVRMIDSERLVEKYATAEDSGDDFVDHSQKKYFPPVGNQGDEGSCTAWAAAYYVQGFYEARDHNWDLTAGDKSKLMSPEFVYHLINGGQDRGSSFHDAARVMENIGVSSLETMPYDDNDHTSWPSAEAFREAGKYRASSTEEKSSLGIYDRGFYYALVIETDEDIEAVKTLLEQGYLISISVDANQYGKWTEGGVWTASDYNPKELNHANTIVGYEQKLD